MKAYVKSISDHYGQANLKGRVLRALDRLGIKAGGLTRDEIASFDEFHIGGRNATRELARLAGLKEGTKVLDLGCGVGGPARTLAAEFGCFVTGIDIIEEYCQTAGMLTAMVGLGERVIFRHGNMTNLPFEKNSFDMAWAQHTTMNIEDKLKLFHGIRPVLRPEGHLAIYEVCTGPAGSPYFPVPWAGDPSISFLVSPRSLKGTLEEAGFNILAWQDVSKASLQWFREQKAAMSARPADAPPSLGLKLLMGETAGQKAANVVRNLEENRISVLQGVLRLRE